jgi:hypothetical protein
LRITDASRSVLPDKHLRVNATKSLQIPVRLAPSVFADDIGRRDTANWIEPAHGVADRQQSIRMDAGWQAESGLRLLLEL